MSNYIHGFMLDIIIIEPWYIPTTAYLNSRGISAIGE